MYGVHLVNVCTGLFVACKIEFWTFLSKCMQVHNYQRGEECYDVLEPKVNFYSEQG